MKFKWNGNNENGVIISMKENNQNIKMKISQIARMCEMK